MSAARDESVPSPGDPDRKRVLNVLAQRRYRQRRREKLKSLEEHAKGKSNPQLKSHAYSSSSCDTGAYAALNYAPHVSPASSSSDGGVSLDDFTPDPSIATNESTSWSGLGDEEMQDLSLSELCASPNGLFNFASLTNQDLELQPDDPFTSTFLFPIGADRNLEIPVLTAFAAGQRLAQLFECMDTLFDPFALRTTSIASLPHVYAIVPPNLLPTPAQEKIPHHPVLDLIPWPDVRTKLICAFSMPANLRPPVARGEMPQISFMQDIDDMSEPCRIAADNELDSDSWEIGNAVYQNWWWAFDKRTVEETNNLRALRGAPRLRLEPARPS